jgi:membrane-associated phospholipid phosphatase
MAFFRHYDPEELARIRLRGSMTPAADTRFLIRPEEAVGGLFFVLLVALALVKGSTLFEPIRSSRLTYLSTKIFAMLVLGLLLWTLAERGAARIRGWIGDLDPETDREAGGRAWARIWRVTRDWLPAILSIGIYESLKHLHLNEIILWLGNTPKDDLMIRIDQALFGGHASVWLQEIISPTLTLFMMVVYYVGYYVYPAVVAVVLYLFRPRAAFREVLLAFLATAFIGYTLYILVPVAGPRFELTHLYHTTFVDKWTLQQWQDLNRFDYDCFPSLHTAIPLVVTTIAFRHVRWLGWVLLPFVLSTVVSTLYLQMHYLIDVLAGIALVPVTVLIGIRGDAWWAALMRRLGVVERAPDQGALPRPGPGRLLVRTVRVAVVLLAIYWVQQVF